MSRQRTRAMVTLAFAGIVAVAWGCNAVLGLDDVARPARDEAEGGPSVDGSTEGGALTPGAACFADHDCPALDPCLTPRCDVAARRCVYATCQPRACERASCEGSPRACTQTVEPYSLVAGDLGLPGLTVGCSSDAAACFAAVYPYAFVGTSTGVLALPLSDLTQLEPPHVPVDLPFAPSQIIASGDVVYFLGPVANGKLALAALRVPTDPRVTRFTPRATQLAYPFASGRLFATTNAEVFLVFADAAKGFPTAILDETLRGEKPIVEVPPPLDAGLSSTVQPGAATGMYGAFGPSFADPDSGAPQGVVASSLDRLVLAQPGVPPRLAVVTSAGTPNAAIGPGQSASSVYSPQDYVQLPRYATSPNGEVVILGTQRGSYDATRFVRAVVGSWVLEPSLTRFGGGDYVTLSNELFDYDGGAFGTVPAPFPGLALPMDGERAFFVTTEKTASPSGVSVGAARRVNAMASPLYPPKVLVFDDPAGDMPPGTIGVAKAAELALVLRKTATGMKILTLDSRCPPK